MFITKSSKKLDTSDKMDKIEHYGQKFVKNVYTLSNKYIVTVINEIISQKIRNSNSSQKKINIVQIKSKFCITNIQNRDSTVVII